MWPPEEPSSVSEIDLYWSDEKIILFLDKYTTGSDLPYNVIAHSSPYQYPPSNLPEGIWYLVHSNEKKESVYGFWKAKGEAREIYSNSSVSGWITTLEYFEGQTPYEKRTDWIMREYTITQKKIRDKDEQKESKLLCRVFFCGTPKSEIEMVPDNCKTVVVSEKTESKEKSNFEVGALADEEPNPLECLITGDFLELNDLIDPQPHYSSSWNSTCSKWSDEYFNSSAFLREFKEDEINYMLGLQLSPSYRFTMPNDVVFWPSISRSRSSGSMKSEVEDVVQELSKDEKGDENATTKRHDRGSRDEGNSSLFDEGTSSGRQMNAESSEEMKAGSSRMKKLKTYFCFSSFREKTNFP